MSQRVRPLFEDASASHELRAFVELARNDGASQAELSRLAARVEATVGIAVAAPLLEAAHVGSAPEQVAAGRDYVVSAFSKSPFAKLLSSTSAKLMAAIGLSAGLGIGLWSQARTSAPVAPAAAAQASRVEAGWPVSSASGPVSPAPVPVVEALRPSDADPPPPVSESVTPKRAGLRRRLARPAEVQAPAENEAPELAPVAPPSELGLIQQAQAQRNDPARAMQLLEEHGRYYPNGALAQEREILAVEVLLRAGNATKARARAERFAREHADSAHLPHLRALLERLGGG